MAVVDTGITEVSDLAGRVVPVQNGGLFGGTSPCKNFSGESTCSDSYGHGTFIAGIIAGNGTASGGKWKGVAPQAKLLSVKIAGASGAADVSNVLAGIQWVVSFKTQYNIKVLNLSLGGPGDLPGLIWQMARPGDVVVCLGAGNITGWAHALPGQLQQIAAEQAGPRAIANDPGPAA